MPNSDARIVRGLSIAVLVLSILAILGALLTTAFLALGGAAITDPSFSGTLASEINSDPELNSYGINSGDVIGLTAVTLLAMGIFVGWLILCSVVSLIAGILGMRNYGNVDKLGAAFGWAIAGAVFSFLCGNIITMILLIISCVYINKVRKAPMVPYGQPQPQPAYGQPIYGQQQGYAQQPYQPQAPATQQPTSQQPADQQQPPLPPAQ